MKYKCVGLEYYRVVLSRQWLTSSERVARTKLPSRTLSVTEKTTGLINTTKY